MPRQDKAPEQIEREMSEIRSRTSANLSDLRKHVDPQMVKEQAQRSLLGYLRTALDSLKPTSGNNSRPLASLALLTAIAVLLVRRASRGDG